MQNKLLKIVLIIVQERIKTNIYRVALPQIILSDLVHLDISKKVSLFIKTKSF